MHQALTRCRICESACGLIADVDEGVVTRLRPDPDHPASAGFACRKGTAFVGVQNHPDRLVRPALRVGGALTDASWQEALDEAGGRLQALIDAHGPSSVGLYLGNAAAHTLGTVLGATALQRALATPKLYSSLTLDNSEMFVVLEEVMGSPMATFVADYAGSDLVVLIGTDPVASQPSQVQSHPGGAAEIIARGRQGELVVVDPRTSATASRASTHLRPRPGSDVPLLAHLVSRALADRDPQDALIRPGDPEVIAPACAAWTLEATAAATGLDAADIRALGDRLLRAERPLVWSGLGVLLGPEGTVGYWLTLVLQAALGGLDRPGGWIHQRGAVDVPRMFGALGIPGRDLALRSRIGGFPAVMGTLAAATLADDILTEGPDQLRALVVIGGNPAVALPDTPRAHQALAALDTLICVDLFVNDTGTFADVVLPAATWLERDELAVHTANQARRPHLQLNEAVTPPRGDAREDWRILIDLARSAGCAPFGSAAADVALRWTGIGPVGIARLANIVSPVSWRALRRRPHGVTLDRDPIGALRARGTDHPDRTAHLAIPEFIDALRHRTGLPAPDGFALQLITSVRPVETMNSWMHHGPGAKRSPVARLHPDDAAALHIADGALLSVWRPDAPETRLVLAVRCDAGLRPGVLVIPYGWGHLPGAIGSGDGPSGVNANVLVGTDRLEPFTGQPLSNGRWVCVAPGAP